MALGDVYLVTKQYGAPIREYKGVLEDAPDLEVARTQLAKALRAEGREAEAGALFTEPPGQGGVGNGGKWKQ